METSTIITLVHDALHKKQTAEGNLVILPDNDGWTDELIVTDGKEVWLVTVSQPHPDDQVAILEEHGIEVDWNEE